MNVVNALGFGISGHVRVEKGRGELKNLDLEFDNLVLNVGWDQLKSRWMGDMRPLYLYLGTGTTEPARTDTGLESVSPSLLGKSATSAIPSGVFDIPNAAYSSVLMRFDYIEGAAAGVWTELGLAYGNTYTAPFNRALFRNESGTPISLTVLADEWLRIFVELRLHWPMDKKTGSFVYTDQNSAQHQVDWDLEITDAITWADGTGVSVSTWRYGLPKFSVPTNDVIFNSSANRAYDTDMTTNMRLNTRTFNLENMYVRYDLVWSVNPTETTTTWRRISFYHTSEVRSQFYIRLSQPLSHLWDHIMEGSWEWSFFRVGAPVAAGTLSSATATTATHTGKNWLVNEFANDYEIAINSGPGIGQVRMISSNTEDTVTVAAWDVQPDATSTYVIREKLV